MDGWMDGWADGWADGRVCECMCGWLYWLMWLGRRNEKGVSDSGFVLESKEVFSSLAVFEQDLCVCVCVVYRMEQGRKMMTPILHGALSGMF